MVNWISFQDVFETIIDKSYVNFTVRNQANPISIFKRKKKEKKIILRK